MTRVEALRRIAELHTAWSLQHGDDVPYVAEDADPHDGQTTDLAVWQADRSAPPEIDDPLNEAIKEILVGITDDEVAGVSAVLGVSLYRQTHTILDRTYKRDKDGRFSSGGGGGGAPEQEQQGGPRTVADLPRGRKPSVTTAAKGTNPRYGETSYPNGSVYREAGKAGKRWTPDMGPLPAGAFEENCTNATMAFEMRMRGYQVQAGPMDVLDRHGYAGGRTYAETDALVTSAWRLPDGSPHGRTFAGQKWRSFDEIDAEVAGWPEGGRGFMTTGKHVFSVVRKGGKAQYVESQFDISPTRIVTRKYRTKYKGSTVISSTREEAKVIRLDDLEPTDGILEAVE